MHQHVRPLGANLDFLEATVRLPRLIAQRIVGLEIVRQTGKTGNERLGSRRTAAGLRREPLQGRDRPLAFRRGRHILSARRRIEGIGRQIEPARGADDAVEIGPTASRRRRVARKAFADEHEHAAIGFEVPKPYRQLTQSSGHDLTTRASHGRRRAPDELDFEGCSWRVLPLASVKPGNRPL